MLEKGKIHIYSVKFQKLFIEDNAANVLIHIFIVILFSVFHFFLFSPLSKMFLLLIFKFFIKIKTLFRRKCYWESLYTYTNLLYKYIIMKM